MTYYDDIGEGYEELHKEEQEKKMQIALMLLKPKKDETLLDVGCGTGLTTAPWPCKRFGIDPAKQLIARAHQQKEIEYTVAPAEKIPYDDHSFDYVVSITAIQNFEDIEKGILEMKRVGKKRFLISALKRSEKFPAIEKLLRKHFTVKERVEEVKDILFLLENRNLY